MDNYVKYVKTLFILCTSKKDILKIHETEERKISVIYVVHLMNHNLAKKEI